MALDAVTVLVEVLRSKEEVVRGVAGVTVMVVPQFDDVAVVVDAAPRLISGCFLSGYLASAKAEEEDWTADEGEEGGGGLAEAAAAATAAVSAAVSKALETLSACSSCCCCCCCWRESCSSVEQT